MNKEHLSKTKRTAAALSAIVLLLSFVSCGKSKFKAGTYTASMYGNNDYIDVQVVLTKDKIASVDVTKHSETRFLGDVAIDTIAKDIVEYQTLNVDSVSGATVTSAAFKSAVYQCIKQANGDTASLNAPVPPKGKKNDSVTTESADIIIVGAGGAGLAAAVTAAQAGAQVIVIEKMPVIGGNTVRCASAFNTADPQR